MVITIDTLGIGFVWPLFGPLFTGENSTFFSNSVSLETRNILYGITIGVANLFSFLCSPIIGFISDHLGRKKILLLCLMGTSVGMIISVIGIIYKQVTLIILSRAWLGMIAGSQAIAQAAIIDNNNSCNSNKSTRLGIISAANNIGFIFGPIVGGILINKTLVSWFNITTPFYFAAILSAFGALFLLFSFQEQPRTFSTSKLQLAKKYSIFTKAFTHHNIRIIALTYILLQIGWAFYLQINFLSLIQKYNYPSIYLAYFLSWLGIIFCINLLVVVRILAKFISLNTVILCAFFVAAICCLVVATFSSKLIIWITILPMTTAIALGSNAILTSLSNAVSQNEQGWIMGIGNSLAAIAWALTPPIAGILLIFGFSLPLLIAGILFLTGTIIWFKKH